MSNDNDFEVVREAFRVTKEMFGMEYPAAEWSLDRIESDRKRLARQADDLRRNRATIWDQTDPRVQEKLKKMDAGRQELARQNRVLREEIERLRVALRKVSRHPEHRTDADCVEFSKATAREALEGDSE